MIEEYKRAEAIPKNINESNFRQSAFRQRSFELLEGQQHMLKQAIK